MLACFACDVAVAPPPAGGSRAWAQVKEVLDSPRLLQGVAAAQEAWESTRAEASAARAKQNSQASARCVVWTRAALSPAVQVQGIVGF